MPGMLLEIVKLRGTEFNRVGAHSRITMLGFWEGLSVGQTSLDSLGVMQEVHDCVNRAGFLAEIAV